VALVASATLASGYPKTTISGTTVTIAYDFVFAGAWDIVLRLTVSQPQGLWTISNLFVIPPNNTVSRTPALAMDDNVVAWLTSAGSHTPAAIRVMDSSADYGGASNFIDPSDIPPPTNFAWAAPAIPSYSTTDHNGTIIPSGTIAWNSYRCYNTDPSKGPSGDGTYGWVSPNLYSTQWGYTGTDSFGQYLALPASDNGRFIAGLTSNPAGTVAVELVSSQPHGLKTGQLMSTSGGGGNIPVTGTASHSTMSDFQYVVFVTGEYTVVIGVGANSTGSSISRVNSTTPIALSGFTGTLQVPQGACNPYEFSASMASQLGSGLWVSIPSSASAACSAAIASRVAANLTPGLKVYVEYMNEHWNDTTNSYTCYALGYLAGYLPTGTNISNYYKTTNGTFLTDDQFYVLQSAMHHDTWYGVFNALGRGGDVVRVFGSQDSNASVTAVMVSFASQNGIPMDSVAMAPYYNMLNDTPFEAACTPAYSGGTSGNWPVDAIIDLVKHSYFYDTTEWAFHALQASYCANWGQPVVPTGLGIYSTTGGSLAPGGYYGYYTFVDSHGNETTVGNSQSPPVVVSTGNVLEAGLPALPVWAASMNLYLTPANGLPGTEVLYASGITGSIYYLTAANAGTVSPPTTNHVPQTHSPPQMVGYEFAPQQLLPSGLPFENQIARDVFYHPAFHDLLTVLFSAIQVGNPSIANSGLSFACFFQLTAQFTNDGGVWALAVSTSQAAGYGTTNQFVTPQGGSPGDNLSHDFSNQTVGVQALRDWLDASAPPGPSITATIPSANATVVSPSIIVTADFNVAVEPSSLAFTIAPTSGGANVSGTVSLDNTAQIATFVPQNPLSYATEYTATVSATGTNGSAMSPPYTWSWTTNGAPPSITATTPSANATAVAIATSIVATFSEAVESSNLSFTIAPTLGGSNVSGTVSLNNTAQIATFVPQNSLSYATEYTATISATGADGVAMSAPYTWSWTTNGAPPSITATTPSANATAVAISNSIIATFSQAIQTGSLVFTIAPTSGGANVSGTVSLDNTAKIATFVPQNSLSYATGYTATVSATGANGIAMSSTYSWSWTTVDLPPSGTAGIPAFAFTFTNAINSTGLTITATVNGSNFPGVTTYNPSSQVATFTPTTPFVAGTKYILTISGATSTDGTPMATVTIPFTPSVAASGKTWFGGLGKPIARVSP
jgi:methionine-rich copper-binding protein CopC